MSGETVTSTGSVEISRVVPLLFLIALAVSTAGCAAVAGIFKAGVWVGVIIAVVVVVAVIALFSRLG
jgi:hypothetical protein